MRSPQLVIANRGFEVRAHVHMGRQYKMIHQLIEKTCPGGKIILIVEDRIVIENVETVQLLRRERKAQRGMGEPLGQPKLKIKWKVFTCSPMVRNSRPALIK